MRLRTRSVEAVAFSVAAVLALAHALDDAFLLPGPGVPLTQHALAAAIALVSTVVAVVAFPRLRPGVRAAIAFTFGVLALVNGGRHLHHVVLDGATANDLTGIMAMAAGVVLVGLAAWIPFRHRGQGAATARRRWAIRAALVPAAVVAVAIVYMPAGWRSSTSIRCTDRWATRRRPPTRPSRSRRPTACASRAGTGRPRTARRC